MGRIRRAESTGTRTILEDGRRSSRHTWWLAAACVIALLILFCPYKRPTIEPWEETLWQAEDCDFDYRGALCRAEYGDREAIVELLRFTSKTDAAGSLGHCQVMILLLLKLGDRTFADAVSGAPEDARKWAALVIEDGAADLEPRLPRPVRELYPATFAAAEGR